MNNLPKFNSRSDAPIKRDEPGEGDDVPCVKCGAVALDTGLECSECGHDNYEAVTGKPFGKTKGHPITTKHTEPSSEQAELLELRELAEAELKARISGQSRYAWMSGQVPEKVIRLVDALLAATPARQWVGLTDEQRTFVLRGLGIDCFPDRADTRILYRAAEAIESKLREKNRDAYDDEAYREGFRAGRAAEREKNAALLAEDKQATGDRLAIKLLVAAGFVTEEKANEALNIANGFADGPLAEDKAGREPEGVVCGRCGGLVFDAVIPQPAERKPLTEEQIYQMYNEPRSDAEMLEFARAIEAAHGIGVKE